MSTVKTQQLQVNEIFYSLQGEGARAGEPSIFIRLKGCSARNACFKSGIDCDTEFTSGTNRSIEWIHNYIKQFDCKWIVWTRGEPLDQLTQEIVNYFSKHYLQALETSGIKKPPKGFEHIALSPKIAEHAILKKWEEEVPHELRIVRRRGQFLPDTKLAPKGSYVEKYVSPHSDGNELNKENLEWCIDLCKENSDWKLSVQMHKLWRVR